MEAKTIEEQRKEINIVNFFEEREQYARDGIATAIESGNLVTIGDEDHPNCDYMNFKQFCTFQIRYMGFEEFADATEWDYDELAEFLADVNSDDDIWKQTVLDYFQGWEAQA